MSPVLATVVKNTNFVASITNVAFVAIMAI